ncbi:hypothetical protein O0L34_g8372 [Tuta absoluta]|nr:hypothetical protein O0L34_g8372 [Tuta absoluta]
MSDEERQEEERGQGEYEPPKKRRKSKRVKRSNEQTDEDVEQPQPSKEFAILVKLINKHTKNIDAKLNELGREVKRTSQAQKALVLNQANNSDSTKESTPIPEVLDKRIVYSITNLNQERPRFGGHNYRTKAGNKIHPVTFLEDLTAYLRKIPGHTLEHKELDIVQECLLDQARDWSRIYKDRWITFQDFKNDFLETYWGEVEQNKVRREIVSNRWDSHKTPTMLEHFLKLAGQVNLLQFTIPVKQLIADIMRHYPPNVQQLWALSRSDTILAATEFLRQLDNINNYAGESSKENKRSAPAEARDEERRPFKKHFRRYQEWKKPEMGQSKKDAGGDRPAVATAAVVEVEVPKVIESGNA